MGSPKYEIMHFFSAENNSCFFLSREVTTWSLFLPIGLHTKQKYINCLHITILLYRYKLVRNNIH